MASFFGFIFCMTLIYYDWSLLGKLWSLMGFEISCGRPLKLSLSKKHDLGYWVYYIHEISNCCWVPYCALEKHINKNSQRVFKSSYRRCFISKGVLKNFAGFQMFLGAIKRYHWYGMGWKHFLDLLGNLSWFSRQLSSASKKQV